MRQNSRTVRAVTAVAALLIVTTLAGPVGAATSAVTGAGTDSVDPLFGAWQKAVAVAPYSTAVDYSAGSAAEGRAEFIAKTTDFAVTGTPFTAAELAAATTAKRTFEYAPIAAGSLAFVYHLFNPQGQPIKGLQLSGPTLAKVFTGGIVSWNDPAILAENPGVSLPTTKIIPTVRGQSDSATYVATSYFRAAAPDVWKAFMEDPSRGFPDEARELYPFFAGVDSRTSSFAISDVVAASEGSNGRIAYVDNAWAKPALAGGADIIKVKNAAGNFVAPTPEATAKTLATAKLADSNLVTVDFATTDPAAYPVAMVNYLVVPTSDVSAEVASAIGTFAGYALKTGQAAATGIGDPVLPAAMVTRSLSVLEKALPTTTTTTSSTTSSTTLPSGTDVSGADATNSGGDGTSLAFTGGPNVGLLLAAGGVLVAVGVRVRRRAAR